MSHVKWGRTGRKTVDLAQTALVIVIVVVLAWVVFALVADGADWISESVFG